MEAKQAMQQFMKQIKESATDSNELIKIIEKMLENPVLINFTEFLELDEIKQVAINQAVMSRSLSSPSSSSPVSSEATSTPSSCSQSERIGCTWRIGQS